MSEVEGSERKRIGSEQLLVWRIPFTAFLIAASVSEHYLAEDRGDGTGLMVTVAMMFVALGASWLGTIFKWPDGILLRGQMAWDVVAISLLIQFTGGSQSLLPLCYCLPILWSAFYASSRSGMVLAAIAAVFTGGGQFGCALGWWWSGGVAGVEANMGRTALVSMIHISLFLVVGLFSGRMADRLRQRRRLQKQVSTHVKKVRSEVRNILDHLSSGLLVVDKSGVITRVNPAAEKILGLPSGMLLGQQVGPALGGEMTELGASILKVLEGGKPVDRHEVRIQRRRRSVPIGISINNMDNSADGMAGVVAIFKDMTDIVQMREKIREKDRLAGVGELSARIAHEIRNPLASIRGSVEILSTELNLEEHNARLFELILRESARVNRIINDFLSFARLRPAEREKMNCSEFLKEMELQIKQHSLAKGSSIHLSCVASPEDLTLTCDVEQLRQVVLNLAINACDAMSLDGSLAISMELSDNSEYCLLRVADSGPGVSESDRETIFKAFVTTKKDGTGLGLPMVARIVAAHAGYLEVENSSFGGAEFRITLPVDYTPAEGAARFDMAGDEEDMGLGESKISAATLL